MLAGAQPRSAADGRPVGQVAEQQRAVIAVCDLCGTVLRASVVARRRLEIARCGVAAGERLKGVAQVEGSESVLFADLQTEPRMMHRRLCAPDRHVHA